MSRVAMEQNCHGTKTNSENITIRHYTVVIIIIIIFVSYKTLEEKNIFLFLLKKFLVFYNFFRISQNIISWLLI